jgi:hypothetical protein
LDKAGVAGVAMTHRMLSIGPTSDRKRPRMRAERTPLTHYPLCRQLDLGIIVRNGTAV